MFKEKVKQSQGLGVAAFAWQGVFISSVLGYCFCVFGMAEDEAIVERLSKVLGVPPRELVRKGLKELLQSQLRSCSAEINELKVRYDIKSAKGLEKKIQDGVVAEHPAWEDLIVLENLEERAKRFEQS